MERLCLGWVGEIQQLFPSLWGFESMALPGTQGMGSLRNGEGPTWSARPSLLGSLYFWPLVWLPSCFCLQFGGEFESLLGAEGRLPLEVCLSCSAQRLC